MRSNALNQVNFGAFGVAVRTGTAVIDVILELLDYYLHQNWVNVVSNVGDSTQWFQKDYDIRTARRLRGQGRHLDFLVTNNSASAGSIRWSVNARLLLKA